MIKIEKFSQRCGTLTTLINQGHDVTFTVSDPKGIFIQTTIFYEFMNI